jgi:hypothetical protein
MPGGVLTAIQAIGIFAEGSVLDVVYIDDQPVPMRGFYPGLVSCFSYVRFL